ncbi:bifunctional lysylphosphatidylglycerol flippase/synthetase MprF [Actinosynnema sp. CS-041913]|uniref:bifunctional lysylphosphatidylglycerol flippase/synthetase MprF n=1 Tax=Actinosynnema sp. CS-041913 TaxID=3239917 RepID=UPI003D8A0EFE
MARRADRLGAVIRRAPATVGAVLALWTLGAATGSLWSGPSDELLDTVGFGVSSPLWTAVTSGLWCANLAGYLATTVLLLLFGPVAEREFGAVRAFALVVVSQVLGVFAGVGLVQVGADWSWLSYLNYDLAVGPSPGIVGLALALSFKLSPLWRRRVRLLVVLGLLVLALYSGYLEDVLRLCGGIVGLVVGLVAVRGRPAPTPPSREETRVLVALLLAASALGPVVVLLSPYADGPLSWFADVLAVPQPDSAVVTTYCTDPDLVDLCRALETQAVYDRLPALLMSVMPALLLLVLAEGLRRGRRFAWWAALVLNVAMTGLIGWYVWDAVVLDPSVTPGVLVEYSIPFLLPLGIVVVLLTTRSHFPLATPVRRFWTVTVGGFVGLGALYVLGGWLARDQFVPRPGLVDLVTDLPTRFLPPGYLGLTPLPFRPDDLVAAVLFEYTGMVFWLVVLYALLRATWSARDVEDADAASRARELMVRHGGTSMSYMTTWRGNRYWFTPDGRAVVAYRVVATIALTVGDPIGPPDACRDAVRGFAEFCAHEGWTPCLYSISEGLRDEVAPLGWHAVQVAEDTVIPLADLRFTGKKWQDVRTALNKAAKQGVTAEWWRYADAPPALTDQIRSISAEWVADKGLPEMGFTLGGLAELSGEGVRCLIAVDADRTVHGVTSWLPVYVDGRIVGWTLDFMRRRGSAFAGSMEFLIASAAMTLKEEGAGFLSLSGAPLARLDRGGRPCGLQRVLDFMGQALEPVYGFRSLFAFKAKFQPVYRPMFMAYPDPAALPRIANAVGRAYLPGMNLRQGMRLARMLAAGRWSR